MLKKSCAILVSIALAMGILVHGSFAYVRPATISLDTFLSNLGINSGTFSAWVGNIEQRGDYRYCVAYQYVNLYNNPDTIKYWMICLSDVPFTMYDNGTSYATVDAYGTVYGCYGNTYDHSFTGWTLADNSQSSVSNSFSIGNPNWVLDSMATNYNLVYANFQTQFFGSATDINLDTSSYFPAPVNHTMDVFINEQLMSVPYLAVRVDDMPYQFMWISVRFEDDYGPGTMIYDLYDLEYFPGDDYQLFLINPFSISSSEFTVTSVLYSGTTDWGYAEVNNLDLVFNEPYLPAEIPSVTPVPDYNYFDTNIINYNGGQKDVFYNSFQVDLKRYEDFDNQGYFKDSFGYLVQPFAFNYILLPSYVVSQGYVYDDFVDDCFYQYDVIITEYYDSYFDFFYGSGAFSSLQTSLAGLSAGTDISPYLDSWYASHSPQVFTYPYFDDSDLIHLAADMPALLVVTDSFYFKQTNFLLGDTGDILSQFSERFYKVGGFSDSLFANISSLYNLNLTFYDKALPQLMNLSYFVNGLRVNEGFDSVVGLLTSVDSYVSSVDSKLNYLVTIDSDLNDLLEWFQNQEDSDVVLTLPDFNSTYLVEIYGENIGDLVGFFQDFVNVLPDFDFSDFPNFFDRAYDLVSDVAGQNDDLLDNLMDPYDYDDSGLSTFGWD